MSAGDAFYGCRRRFHLWLRGLTLPNGVLNIVLVFGILLGHTFKHEKRDSIVLPAQVLAAIQEISYQYSAFQRL
jgi:hypothetical protein